MMMVMIIIIIIIMIIAVIAIPPDGRTGLASPPPVPATTRANWALKVLNPKP